MFQRYQENSRLSACINELQSLEAGEVQCNVKLKACNGLFMALNNVAEAVEITNSNHEIQVSVLAVVLSYLVQVMLDYDIEGPWATVF